MGTVYVLTTMLQRLAAFVVLPWVASSVGPTTFGHISVATSLGLVATYALPVGQDVIVTRELTSGSSQEAQARQIATSLRVVAAMAIIGLVLAGLLSLAYRGTWLLVLLEVAAAVLVAAATTISLAAWRARRQAGSIARLLLAITATQALGRVGLTLLLDGQPWAWGLGSMLGAVVAVAATAKWNLVHARVVGEVGAPRASAVEGAGYLPHQLASWGLSAADRPVLAALVSSSALGIYSLAYQICAVLSTLLTEVNRALLPSYGKGRGVEAVRRLTTLQAWSVAAFGSVAVVVGPPVVRMILPPSFDSGGRLAYPLIVGTVCFGFYLPCANLITMRATRGRRLSYATSVALMANVVLNLLLVPTFGLMAAAWATAGAYATLALGGCLLLDRQARQPVVVPALAAAALLGGGFAMHTAVGLPLWLSPALLLLVSIQRLLTECGFAPGRWIRRAGPRSMGR